MVAGAGVLAGVANCSGDNTGVDGGQDGGQDVTPEYYVADVAPPTPMLMDIAAGASHTCAVVAYGSQNATFCFGKDGALGGTKSGVLATAATGNSPSPSFASIMSGPEAAHTCAIDNQHVVWCWGDNTLGQCAQGNPSANVATATGALDFNTGPLRATGIGIGKGSTCTIRYPDLKLTCSGDNTLCQSNLHTGNTCDTGLAAAQLGTDDGVVFQNLSIIASGSGHACAYGSPVPSGTNQLFCWGDNASLQSGPGPAGVQATAVAATTPPTKVISLTGGQAHTCFVTDPPHQLYCFGKNDQHQADPASGSATIDPTGITPIALPQSAIPLTVATGLSETCAVDISGQIWCFGASHGTNIDAISGIKDVTKVVMGGGHTCALGHAPTTNSGPVSLFCWGDNTDGQAGQTAGGTVATPTLVAIPQTAPQ